VFLAAIIAALLIIFSREGDLIIALSNVTAIIAMLVVNVGAFRLAWQGWPGEGVKLPGGVTIPLVGFAAAAAQLPSLGLEAVLIGTCMTLAGYLIFALRHKAWLAGEVSEQKRRIRELETPLARALRRVKRTIEAIEL
jgi:hypothetical protein